MFEPITAEQMRESYASAGIAFGRMTKGDMAIIIAEFAKANGLTVAQLKSPLRTRKYAWPRQVLMVKLWRETGRSLSSIGRALGGRDHTTVIHGIRAATARAQT